MRRIMNRLRRKSLGVTRALAAGTAVICLAAADEVRVDLDRRDDPHVHSRVDAGGYSMTIELEGHLDKLQPRAIRIETQQKGKWSDVQLEAGSYLSVDYDPEKPEQVRIESTLKFDFEAGERRFVQERDTIQREVQRRAGGKEAAAVKARSQLLMERIAALREENIQAGADKRGRATLLAPALPRVALQFEKPEALERILKEQCYWKPVAEVFKATGFRPPDDRDNPDFGAAMVMAEEIRQAIMGIKFSPRQLSESQYKALIDGSRYQFSARFVPTLPDDSLDMGWKNAPAVRLGDGTIKRATLEGGLDRERSRFVAWWRIECDAPNRLQPDMAKGDGDCFWTWVETSDPQVRYLRLVLHSPGTRYRMNVNLIGAAKGEEIVVYDGPFNAPLKGAF